MVSISRVSRDGRSVILKSSTGYDVFSLDSPDVLSGEFESLVASGSWRRPTKGDAEAFEDLLSLADGAIIASSEAVERPRTFKAPKNVRNEISAALMEFSALLSDSDRETANRIVSGPVTKEDIQWMHTFFSQVEKAQKLRGGAYGQRWAAKICAIQDPLTASVAPFDDDLYYYGISDTEGSKHIQALLAVDPNTDNVYEWENGIFQLKDDENLADIDEPSIIPLDGETAAAVAMWINQQPIDQPFGYDVYNHNYEERNLYEMAAPEIDYEMLGRVASIVAVGYGPQGYTSAERSVNASRQQRAAGGKFGGSGGNKPTGQQLTAFAKAILAGDPSANPLVSSIQNLVNSWLKGLGPFAVKPRKPRGPSGPRTEAQKAHTRQVKATNKAAKAAHHASTTISITAAGASGASAETPDDGTIPADPLYLAIVDDVDKNSVLDVVAIRANDETGEPEAWVRKDGKWVFDADMLAKLMGSSPPTVRELAQEDTVKAVLQQVDDYDGSKSDPVADDTSTSEQINNLSVGFSLPDGSFPIYNSDQLFNAVDTMQTYEPSVEEKDHVRKRARALNRMDILPKEWRTASFLEKGIIAGGASDLYGEFGQIVAAGSIKGHVSGAERLKEYWCFGKGAAKIRWGTKGDLTRAHRHLAKYVGEDEAWGLVQNYHETVFGMSNYKHDKLAGQL